MVVGVAQAQSPLFCRMAKVADGNWRRIFLPSGIVSRNYRLWKRLQEKKMASGELVFPSETMRSFILEKSWTPTRRCKRQFKNVGRPTPPRLVDDIYYHS